MDTGFVGPDKESVERAKHVRLFVALSVCDHLKECARLLPRKGLEGRWLHPDDLHITVRFLGDVEEARLDAIIMALDKVKRPNFGIDVEGLAAFRKPRQSILYAVVQSTRKLETLCADVTDVLTPLKFDFGTRPYVPHMTLARLKKPHGLDDYIEKNTRLFKASWTASEFMLMRSAAVPDGRGQRYEILRRFPLGR